jgi:predicted dehydrogenase
MLRLGVVGYGGRIGSVIKHDMRGAEPDLRVVGVLDPDEQGVRARLDERDRRDVAFYDSLDRMVREARLDGLAIGTLCDLHAPYAIEAARYDIPLFLEKPVAVSMEQAVALERAFEGSKCEVVVSFPLRVTPLCVLAREKIEQGAVGSPEHILGTNYVPYGAVYWDDRRRNYPITQGLFLQKATHDLDYMSYLMGSRIVRVGAMWTRGRVFGGDKPAGLACSACSEADECLESPRNRARNRSETRLHDHPCVFSIECGTPQGGMNEDSSSALLEFASGVHGAYTQVFYTRRDAAARGATVSGYHGTVSFDWYRNELKWVEHHRPFSHAVKPDAGLSHFGGDVELGRDFVRAMKRQGRSRATIADGIQSVYACLAAKESAETGRFVDVRQVGL